MATAPQPVRILIYAAALALCVVALGMASTRLLRTPLRNEPVTCTSVPAGMALSDPVLVIGQDSLPAISELGWQELRPTLQEGDLVQSYRTATTTGHVALRGKCLLGRTVAQVR